jgi:membrane associated rhomboid family serine protease
VIPIADEGSPRRRFPAVTVTLIALNALVFLYETSLPAPELQRFVLTWGVVPREYAAGHALLEHGGAPYWVTLVTAMFIHGGWGHLIGNMLYLWVFGDNIEDRLGRPIFVLFYLAAGVAAAFAQMWTTPMSALPSIGASGAIAGVLGAYIVLYPRNRVRVFFILFLIDVPAVFMLGIWILTQLVSGVGALAAPATETSAGGIAYAAHVGGFAVGALTGVALRARKPRPPRQLRRPTSPRFGY